MEQKSGNRNLLIIVIVLLFALLLCVVLAVIGLLAYRSYLDTQTERQATVETNQTPDQMQNNDSSQTPVKEYTIESKNLKKDGTTYSIDDTYPQVAGLDNSVQQSVNKVISDYIKTASDQIISSSVGDTTAVGPYSESYDYSVEYKTKDLLSILMTGDDYTGGAHPNSVVKTFNFDMNTGTEIQLSDVFTSGSSYLNTLSSLTNSMLVASLGSAGDGFIDGGTTPIASNFKNFNFTDSGFKITFDTYQVAPYAMGTPDVTIPYASISTILNPVIAGYL